MEVKGLPHAGYFSNKPLILKMSMFKNYDDGFLHLLFSEMKFEKQLIDCYIVSNLYVLVLLLRLLSSNAYFKVWH